ncbi:hypothetical protein GJ688_04045 [Heliobacillus mobilis]|uniref:Uncharacterized protein n=1 Tax=Heliobacterium mobile TaxID=28064 RepID=A0A6I3SH26_HELMO|nr:hypothetical protein [Heliobacterium mobile]MTV48154.1 hypothetical protein [Heliobacterium mobile]
MGLHRSHVYNMLEQAKTSERQVYVYFSDGTVKRYQVVDIAPPLAYVLPVDLAEPQQRPLLIEKIVAVEWA